MKNKKVFYANCDVCKYWKRNLNSNYGKCKNNKQAYQDTYIDYGCSNCRKGLKLKIIQLKYKIKRGFSDLFKRKIDSCNLECEK